MTVHQILRKQFGDLFSSFCKIKKRKEKSFELHNSESLAEASMHHELVNVLPSYIHRGKRILVEVIDQHKLMTKQKWNEKHMQFSDYIFTN